MRETHKIEFVESVPAVRWQPQVPRCMILYVQRMQPTPSGRKHLWGYSCVEKGKSVLGVKIKHFVPAEVLS